MLSWEVQENAQDLELKLKVFFCLVNQQRNFLVTIGEDEQLTPQNSALCLKVFDLDKMQSESSSTASPDCVGILRIFTNQFPEAQVMRMLCILVTLHLERNHDNNCLVISIPHFHDFGTIVYCRLHLF